MDENELLVLGLLRTQDQHGYQINTFIDKNLGRLTTMKRPTAYATLDRLHRQGFVASRTEQAGNHAPRRVYAITAAGEARFRDLLAANLSAAHLTSTSEIGLLFLDGLPLAKVIDHLTARRAEFDALIEMHERVPAHGQGMGVDLALGHFLVMLRAERDWLTTTLRRLTHEQAPSAENAQDEMGSSAPYS